MMLRPRTTKSIAAASPLAADTAFIEAVAAALNDRARLADLDRFPAWRDQATVTLETEWPTP